MFSDTQVFFVSGKNNKNDYKTSIIQCLTKERATQIFFAKYQFYPEVIVSKEELTLMMDLLIHVQNGYTEVPEGVDDILTDELWGDE